MGIDSAIFAEQKSKKNVPCGAPLSNTQNPSNIESKADSESMERLESSLLDSLSHGYCLDSQNRLFAQKEKGFIPSPLAKAPKRIKRRFFAALRLQPVGSFCAATKYIFWRECLAVSLSSQKC